MKISWSGIGITDGRGKFGTTVSSANRAGAYVKRLQNPINRNSSAQAAVRAFFSTLTKGWAALTVAQKNSWNVSVNNFKKTNSLAKEVILSGHQLYISINRVLQTIGGATITTAPYPAPVTAVLTAAVAAGVAADTIIFTYTPAVPATHTLIIEATRAMSAGKQSKSQDYKFVEAIVAADVSPYDVEPAYETVFGDTWKTAGAKIFWRFTPVITLTGVKGTSFFAETIVVA